MYLNPLSSSPIVGYLSCFLPSLVFCSCHCNNIAMEMFVHKLFLYGYCLKINSPSVLLPSGSLGKISRQWILSVQLNVLQKKKKDKCLFYFGICHSVSAGLPSCGISQSVLKGVCLADHSFPRRGVGGRSVNHAGTKTPLRMMCGWVVDEKEDNAFPLPCL